MKHKLFLIVLFIFIAFPSFAQRVPDWVTNTPCPTNGTYLYVVESASGTSEISARNQAIARVFQATAMRLGQPINSEEINRAVQSGTSYDVISRNYNIPINKVCEYTETKSGSFRVYILCQVAKAGNIPVQFEAFNACYEGANKRYAEEAWSSDGFNVYYNKRLIGEREVRSLLANSRAYDCYDRGMSIYHSEFWNNDGKGGATTLELIGGIPLYVGALISMIGYSVYLGFSFHDNEDSPEIKGIARTGLKIAAVGGAIILLNTGVKAYGKAQVRKAINLYNNGALYTQNSIEMRYGFTGNSVYLSFNF